MMWSRTSIIGVFLLGWGDGSSSSSNSSTSATTGVGLRPESELVDNCFDFPAQNFNKQNNVKLTYGSSPYLALREGDRAIDFTLDALDGTPFSLSQALAEGKDTGDSKPVVLIWGMYTCPAFQGMGSGGDPPFDECAYWDESTLVEQRRSQVNFVHLVGPEPHPTVPDTNFDSGEFKENYWSTVRQPMDYTQRRAMVKAVRQFIHPKAVLLADDLVRSPTEGSSEGAGEEEPTTRNNPVWCSYGPGARTAMLIGTDGIVRYTSTWFRASDMLAAIDDYLGLESVAATENEEA